MKDKVNQDFEPQKSSAAQFLTYIASTGKGGEKYEIRYKDEKIALGFKIDNERAVQFRRWANRIVGDKPNWVDGLGANDSSEFEIEVKQRGFSVIVK